MSSCLYFDLSVCICLGVQSTLNFLVNIMSLYCIYTLTFVSYELIKIIVTTVNLETIQSIVPGFH